ncbi:DNA integration/recombination/inversion protein (plasmid) [Mycetohabitans rhizoxinica HKI 454]|uniref:DNA integration/recombination/inversion protein n=1 Tax=Mycetohabitans rhizoxinica (strain DSM 19002 / CIP 109453 / HKI 454) TaxID=882378 RepID=E5AW59_MYCRK|nr:DNA integration/recombination/inversion protein [Mycetohabitans rhizoxinica HKI 454]
MLALGLVERHTSGVDSSWVFPGGGDARPMHSVTALRATEAIMRVCGVVDRRQARTSPQTL